MPFQPPYKAAVIGRTGRGDYGHNLDLSFLGQPKLQLVAVADESEPGRAMAAKRLGVERAYADYREMLQKERPAFVAICPRWLDGHEEMVLACAENGVRGIYCEKPLATTVAACDAIVAACDRSHVQLAMAFQMHYSPVFVRVKRMIADGVIGEVLEVRGRGKEDRRGGGEDLMVLGAHVMDLFADLLGDPAWCFARVTERGEPIGAGDVREGAEGIGPLSGDRVDAMYGFHGKAAVAHFATSRPAAPGGRFGLQIYGEKGAIALGFGWLPPAFLLEDPTWLATGGGNWVPISSTGPGVPEPLADSSIEAGNRVVVEDLIRAVETDTSPLADARAGARSIEMILACYASQIAGGPVSLPLAQRDEHPLRAIPRA
jgi:predicted dehydrogenase